MRSFVAIIVGFVRFIVGNKLVFISCVVGLFTRTMLHLIFRIVQRLKRHAHEQKRIDSLYTCEVSYKFSLGKFGRMTRLRSIDMPCTSWRDSTLWYRPKIWIIFGKLFVLKCIFLRLLILFALMREREREREKSNERCRYVVGMTTYYSICHRLFNVGIRILIVILC
jgi:hypothetical protein